jgi:hypothetical protein
MAAWRRSLRSAGQGTGHLLGIRRERASRSMHRARRRARCGTTPVAGRTNIGDVRRRPQDGRESATVAAIVGAWLIVGSQRRDYLWERAESAPDLRVEALPPVD